MSLDYGNTIIYKIACNDAAITDLYVGHTTDFVKRKYAHCKSSADPNCTNKLYTTIREHGGWSNWTMKIIGYFDCQNLSEAREKEQELFVQLGATLNSVEPLPMRREKMVTKVKNSGVKPKEKAVTVKHGVSKISIAEQTPDKFKEDLCCRPCDYVGTCPANLSKHMVTSKHRNITKQSESPKKLTACKSCGKGYAARNSLWYHEIKCKPTSENKIDITTQVEKLINDNIEFRRVITDQNKIIHNFMQSRIVENTNTVL